MRSASGSERLLVPAREIAERAATPELAPGRAGSDLHPDLHPSAQITRARGPDLHPSAQITRAGGPDLHPSAQITRAGGPGLSATIVAVRDLDGRRRDAMFEIFARHYDEVSRDRFDADLAEKDGVVVLTGPDGTLSGFSTQKTLRARVGGRAVRALFSGDTVIDRSQWGEQELCRGWSRYAGMVLAEEPDTPLYWFLVSKGYRTYLYLPLFFREFYPRVDVPAPPFEQQVLDAFARLKFASHYDPETGLIAFPHSMGQLTGELATVPTHRRDHAHVRFFLERNPNYARGTELACLAQISVANLTSFGRRLFESALRR